MDVGFTGTRRGMTEVQWNVLRAWWATYSIPCVFHGGDCIGADDQAYHLALDKGWRTIGHIPTKDHARAFCSYDQERASRNYLARNRDIVDQSGILYATPKEMTEQPRGGTWYTINYARKQGKPIVIIWPDGSVSEENRAKSESK